MYNTDDVTVRVYTTVLASITLTNTATTTTVTVYSTAYEPSTSTVSSIVTELSSTTVTSVTTKSTTSSLMRRDKNDEANVVPPNVTPAPQIDVRDTLLADWNLEELDKIVVSGKKLSYASSCGNVESFAIACLCWGVPHNVIRDGATTMVTIRRTSTPTVYATGSVTITSSITSTVTATSTRSITNTRTTTYTYTSTSVKYPAPTVYTAYRAGDYYRIAQNSATGRLAFIPSPRIDPSRSALIFRQYGDNAQPLRDDNTLIKFYINRLSSDFGYIVGFQGANTMSNVDPLICTVFNYGSPSASGNNYIYACTGSGLSASFNTFFGADANDADQFVYFGTATQRTDTTKNVNDFQVQVA